MFKLTHSIQRDNKPLFMWEMSQKIGHALQIQWKLHASWRPRSMGRMRKWTTQERPWWKYAGHTFEMGPGTPYCLAPGLESAPKHTQTPWDSLWETLPSSCFRDTFFGFRTWIKNQTIWTTPRAKVDNFAQVCSLQVHLPIWQALTLILAGRPSLTKDLEDSRPRAAVSWAIDQSLWCPTDNTLLPKALGTQSLDPPHTDEVGATWGGFRSCCSCWYCKGKLDLHSWKSSKIPLLDRDSLPKLSDNVTFHFILHFPDRDFLSKLILLLRVTLKAMLRISLWGSFSLSSFWFHYISPHTHYKEYPSLKIWLFVCTIGLTLEAPPLAIWST